MSTADFISSAVSGNAPLTVHFTGLSDDATSWEWDLTGDGTTDGTGKDISYTYSSPGRYTVSLTISDSQPTPGTFTKSKTHYIHVTTSDFDIDRVDTCLSKDALQELSSMEIDIPSKKRCTVLNTNSCDMSLGQLLETYPVFANPASQERLYDNEEKVLFFDAYGYKATLKQANESINSNADGLDQSKWTVLCELKLQDGYEPEDAYAIYNSYTQLDLRSYWTRWGRAAGKWGQADSTWSAGQIDKEYIYRKGDVYHVLGECEDVICIYMVTDDVLPGETLAGRSEVLRCANTGFQKCVGYQRKKSPKDLYEVVQIGSRCDYIEVPVKYTPPRPLLNGWRKC
jgi:PKD repeat protein